MKDKKIFMKFVIIMVISLICGGFIGFGIGHFENNLFLLGTVINHILKTYGLYAYVIELVLLILGTYFYYKGKQIKQLDDDSNYELASRYLNLSSFFSNIAMPFVYIAMGLSYTSLFDHHIAITLGLLIVSLMWGVFLQKKIVEKIKELAPEKQVNVFDTKFQKDWYNSCDEMERAQIGRCCYEVFKIMGSLYLIVMVVLCCLAISGWVEPLWIIVFGLMWLIQQGIYSYYAIKEG